MSAGIATAIGSGVVDTLFTGLEQEDVTICTLNPSNHIYYAKLRSGKSKQFKSVTGILKIIDKPALLQWAANLAGDYMEEHLQIGDVVTDSIRKRVAQGARQAHKVRKEEAGDLGTGAHALISRWLCGDDIAKDLANCDDRVQNCVQLFWQWWQSQNLEVMHSEVCVWDARLGMAGTVDFVCRSRTTKKIMLIDFKTGNGVWPEQFLQLAAYVNMLYLNGIDVEEAAILRIGKHDAKPFFYDCPMESLRLCFVGVLCAFSLGRVIDKINGALKGENPEW